MSQDAIRIDGPSVTAISPEGRQTTMPVETLIARIRGQEPAASRLVLPDGVKCELRSGSHFIHLHQSPPAVRNLRWISDDSPRRFGPGTKYHDVRLALPYLITFAVFGPGEQGQVTLTAANECFFSGQPLASLDDPLCFPGLLNCSRFDPPEGRPLSWICTQKLNRSFDLEADFPRRIRAGFAALLSCLFETGFNYSSEEHEGSSWWTESRGVDPRISSVKAWQEASERDPSFVLDVPWLKTGLSAGQIADRIFANLGCAVPRIDSAAALARLIVNHREPRRGTAALLKALL